jgi:hypothetical protein
MNQITLIRKTSPYIKLAPLSLQVPRIFVAGDVITLAKGTSGASEPRSYLVTEVDFQMALDGRWPEAIYVYASPVGQRAGQ